VIKSSAWNGVLVLGLLLTASSAWSAEASGAPGAWLPLFLGRLHPLLVHFPVALLPTALLAELLGRRILRLTDG
jgi:hypothetical protein